MTLATTSVLPSEAPGLGDRRGGEFVASPVEGNPLETSFFEISFGLRMQLVETEGS